MNSYSQIYQELLLKLAMGEKSVVATDFSSDSTGKHFISKKSIFTEKNFYNDHHAFLADARLRDQARYALESGLIQFVDSNGKNRYLLEPYFPQPRLVVLGGGHIAKPLVEFGAKVGFAVTVFDDRPSFANTGRFPIAEKVLCENFADCTKFLELNKSAFVVIVTRGHRHDMECLKQILKFNCAYVGMIGSKRRVKGVKEQLLDEGFTQNALDQVCAPIGLDIGAVIPEEIAISIIAQVISYRRGAHTSSETKIKWPEFDKGTLEVLSQNKDEPKAMVTITSTKGSVPRKAGAKMLVWMDGRTLGTIGGGCSESEVITASRDAIREGSCTFQTIDMTGLVAEEAGMVCGGTMDVIIEPC